MSLRHPHRNGGREHPHRTTPPSPARPKVRPSTYDKALHRRIQARPSIFLERRG